MMKYDTSRLTPRMVRCLERADEYADQFGHNYTGTEHVVLAILADREAVPTDIAHKTGAQSVLLYELLNFLETGKARDPVVKLVQEQTAAAAAEE